MDSYSTTISLIITIFTIWYKSRPSSTEDISYFTEQNRLDLDWLDRKYPNWREPINVPYDIN
jgi:hypothetical protein